MSEVARKIARTARRAGFRSVTLGQFKDSDWDALRAAANERDATDLECADAADTLANWEQNGPRQDDRRGVV